MDKVSIEHVLYRLGETWGLNGGDLCSFVHKYCPMAMEDRNWLTLLISIRSKLDGLFRDVNSEREWLREKHKILDGAIPLDLILKGEITALTRVEGLVAFMCGQ